MAAQDNWMRGLVEACRRDRFVTTIGGRRRYLIDIDSSESGRRAAAERQAINSAVQVALQTPCELHDCVGIGQLELVPKTPCSSQQSPYLKLLLTARHWRKAC